jgi:type IV secretory pathway VirB4 component
MNPSNQPINPTAGGPAGSPSVIPPQSSAKSNPNSTQNALQISEIRDGIVILNDGSFRAVIMCKSINFDLMSPQEREAVEFSYQGFLNSLYFPVQIFMRSQKVDLKPYLERMDKIRSEHDNMLLSLLMEDYIAFLGDIAQQTNIMDKRFYVVIKYPDIDQDVRKALKQSTSFFSGLAGMFSSGKTAHVVIDETSLEKAKAELRNRVQAVMQGLSEAGIQSLPLDTEELIELYYDAYNPDTATRQQIKDFSQLNAPVITKGQGMAPRPTADGSQI